MENLSNANGNWKRKAARFLISQNVSLFGTSLVQYAIMWYVTLYTGSGFMMTLSIIFGFLPTFFLSPFAGVWADRFDRKKLIIYADGGIALATAVMVVFFLMGYESVWLMFVISAIRAFGSSVQQPAVNAFIPQFTPEDQLMRVNGINGSIQSFMMLISPMVSGVLMTLAPIETIFMIDVVTAIFAILIIAPLKVEQAQKQIQQQGEKIDYFADLKQGIDYIRNHAYLKRFYVFIGVFHFLITPVAMLSPLQVTRNYGGVIWRLTAIEIAFSSGMLIGGLLISAWGGFKNRIHTMTLSTMTTGLLILVLGTQINFYVYLFIMFSAGITIPLFSTPSTVLLQENVDNVYLGRVFSVMSMIYSVTMPIGMLLFGPLADAIAIEWLLLVTGALVFIQGFFLIGSKVLVTAGEKRKEFPSEV
ncbi:MAG: MFS transporter [Clostridiales bacterium 38-18]|nr:MAG: MFS transporter [Clostridiales bacterium 38-18]